MTIVSHDTLAACTRADITGTWRIYSRLENYSSSPSYRDSVINCKLVMPGSGQAISSTSVCTHYIDNIPKPLLSGNLTIDAACHITGTVKIGGEQRKLDAWVSKGKDSMSGMMWNPTFSSSYHDLSEIFSGVKL